MTLLITKRVKLIEKKEFAIMVIYDNVKVFIVYITFLSVSAQTIWIYLAKKTQIVLLLAEKIKILVKYSDSSDLSQKKGFSITKDNHFKITCYQVIRNSTTIL